MAQVLTELFPRLTRSRGKNGETAVRIFTVTDDAGAAVTADDAINAGPAIGDLYPGSTTLRVVDKKARDLGNISAAELTVEYGEYQQTSQHSPTGESEIVEFDTSAANEQIEAGYAVDKGVYEPIGQNAEGVSVYRPNWQETITEYYSSLSISYVDFLYKTVGCVNDYWWRNYPPESVLYLGAVGSKRGDANWQVTYRFLYRPYRTVIDYTSSGMYTDDDGKKYNKKVVPGWYYVWNEISKSVPATGERAGELVVVVGRTHIVQVYPKASFSPFLIPSPQPGGV